MSLKKFECHITINHDRPSSEIKRIVESFEWKFSCIEGDADLGNAMFCYATRWYEDRIFAIAMTHMFKDKFVGEGLSVVRVKVEEVLHDSRIVNGQWKEIQ